MSLRAQRGNLPISAARPAAGTKRSSTTEITEDTKKKVSCSSGFIFVSAIFLSVILGSTDLLQPQIMSLRGAQRRGNLNWELLFYHGEH